MYFGFLSFSFFFLEIMTKFNKDMYAKMRSKKDEPLSNIGKKGVRITGKGPPVLPSVDATPIISGVESLQVASPATSVEEIPPRLQKGSVCQLKRRRRRRWVRPSRTMRVWPWSGHITS